jgi:hypothetical protein
MRRPQNCRRVPEHVHSSVCTSAKQIADDVCTKNPPFEVIAGQEFQRESPSSSSCQYGSTSSCRFILSVSLNPHFPKLV